MAKYYELDVYKAANNLFKEYLKIKDRLPKEIRYSLGESIMKASVTIMTRIYRASIAPDADKVKHLVTARELIVEIKIYIRAIRDFNRIGVEQMAHFAELSESVERQLAGWHRKVLERIRGNNDFSKVKVPPERVAGLNAPGCGLAQRTPQGKVNNKDASAAVGGDRPTV